MPVSVTGHCRKMTAGMGSSPATGSILLMGVLVAMNNKYKPGSGWSHIAGPVWENTDGCRIHLLGLIRLPDMTYMSANKISEGNEARRFIRINGGNRRRGLMAWAKFIIASAR